MVLKPDDFTEHAQEVIAKSQDAVRQFRHSQWDVEHILLALLEQEDGVASEIFRHLLTPSPFPLLTPTKRVVFGF